MFLWGGEIMAQNKSGKVGVVGKAVASKNNGKSSTSSSNKTSNKSGKR